LDDCVQKLDEKHRKVIEAIKWGKDLPSDKHRCQEEYGCSPSRLRARKAEALAELRRCLGIESE